jgi:hypothetical protein
MSYAEKFTQTHRVLFGDAARLAIDNYGSKLRATVSEMTCMGEQHAQFTYYDKTKAQRVEGRAPANIDTPTNRRLRWVKYQPTFTDGEFIDRNDVFQGMTNYQSPLMQSKTNAVQRFIDEDVIVAGVFGDAYEGALGSTAIAFPASQVIAVNVQDGGGTGAVGMNLAKFRASRKKFALNGHNFDIEEPYCILTAEQIDDLSNDPLLLSQDYRKEAGPQFSSDGKLMKVWNHWIVEYQNLPTKVLATRPTQRVPVYLKSTMMLGVWQDVQFKTTADTSKMDALYMWAEANMDCRRADEKGVVEIECDLG